MRECDQMDIYVLDGLNGIIGMLENYQSCIWTTQSMGLGNFEIITQGTIENIALLKQGRYLVRDQDYISSTTFRNVMIIESVKVEFESEQGWMLTVSGRGLKSIVGRRIVWNRLTTDGLSIGDKVSDMIYTVITENVSRNAYPNPDNRKIENFKVIYPSGLDDEADIQLFGENIGDWLEEVCRVYGYSWDVSIKKLEGLGPFYVFELYKGIDRSTEQDEVPPVVFSQEFDNLLSASYTSDKTRYRNAALIGGEGEGSDKVVAGIGATRSGLDRYELYVDGSGVSSDGEVITAERYRKMLQSYGRTELWGYTIEKTFEGAVEASGTYELDSDYFLGDRVTVDTGLGIYATPLITEIIDSVSEDGRTTILNFQDWEVEV